jgi:hypothetical protein
MTRTTLVFGLFLAAIVAGFALKYLPRREGFMQKEIGMPVSGSPMGPYDGQTSKSLGGWSVNEEPMPVGSLPQNLALEQNKLMYLVDNKTSSSCCPGSGLSSDTGCVCLSESQKAQMNTRFGNR